MRYRQGNIKDLEQLKQLVVKAWEQLQKDLTTENWQKLYTNLNKDETYLDLLRKAHCLVCENDDKEIIGVVFLVPKGNPTEIYDHMWCSIRLLSVHPEYGGRGIGKQLIEKCIEIAKCNHEQTIALHTSEIMKKARHIYENIGFKVFKEIEPRFGIKYWLYTLEIN